MNGHRADHHTHPRPIRKPTSAQTEEVDAKDSTTPIELSEQIRAALPRLRAHRQVPPALTRVPHQGALHSAATSHTTKPKCPI